MFFTLFFYIILVGIVIFFMMLYTVQQQTSAIVERFGKFSRIAAPGLNIKIPFALLQVF